MKSQHLSVIALATAVLLIVAGRPGLIQAEPMRGVAFSIGPVSTELDETDEGVNYSVDSSGVAFGFDFQIPSGNQLSLNPFLAMSSEQGPFVVDGVDTGVDIDVDSTIIGLQVRYWATNNAFLGGIFANVSGKISATVGGTTISDSGSGLGFGGIVGFESDGGLSVSGQYLTADIDGTDQTSLIFLIGYRFGLQ